MKFKTDFYTTISKIEDQDDGSIIVEGIASTEDKDADGEIIKADSMKAVLPDYMKYGSGNLREMHQLSAVGIVTSAVVDGNGDTHIVAKVVDPVAVMKVKNQVYKGFSVRGMASQDATNPKILTMRKLTEISLVDRPNNGRSLIHTVKIEDGKSFDDDSFSTPTHQPTQPIETVKIMNKKLAEALAQLQANPILAQTLRGVEVMKSLVADEREWAAGEDAQKRRDLLDSCDKILSIAKSLAPATLDVEINKCLASAASESSQEVIKALTASVNIQKAELDNIKEACKAYGLPEDTGVEGFIQAVSKRLAELSALPGAPKGVLKVVSKSDDGGTNTPPEKTVAPVRVHGSTEEDKAATEIKKIHAAGGTPYDPIQIVG